MLGMAVDFITEAEASQRASEHGATQEELCSVTLQARRLSPALVNTVLRVFLSTADANLSSRAYIFIYCEVTNKRRC